MGKTAGRQADLLFGRIIQMAFRLKSRKTFPYPLVIQKKSLEKIPLPKVLWVSFILNVLTIVIVVFSQNNLPGQVPLFYGMAEGEEQLASSMGLIIPALLSLGLIIFNTSLAVFLKDDFLQKVLILTSLLVSIFSTITTFKIIFLVGSFSF